MLYLNSNNYYYYYLERMTTMQTSEKSRRSKQRTAILQVLQATDTHPSADWVYRQVSREIPNISLGTVYRNLAQLAASGIIQRMEIGNGVDRFDFNEAPHYHLFCIACNQLLDLDLPYDERLDQQAENSGAGKIHSHSLIFHGVCRKCLNQMEKE